MPYGQNNDESTILVSMIKLIASWIGIIISLFIVIVLVVWGFSLNVSDNAEIPVVKAKVNEFRVIPDEPGGQIVNYQGLSVNSVQEKGSAQIAANQIRLAPEPIDLIEEMIILEKPMVTNEENHNESALADENEENVDELNGSTFQRFTGMFTSVRPKFKSYRELAIPIAEIESVQEAEETEEVTKVQEIVLKSGTNFVELGSYKTNDKANRAWLSMSKGNSLIFKNKEQLIIHVITNGEELFKLRALGFINVVESRNFCDQLRDWVTTCLPSRAK